MDEVLHAQQHDATTGAPKDQMTPNNIVAASIGRGNA
jgi:hypothetical protein